MVRYALYQGRKNLLIEMSMTNKLILINVFFYVASLLVLSIYGEIFFLDNLALTPSLIFAGKSIWTFLTSMFVHVQLFHIFANMFSLFFIGNFLERLIGWKRFLLIYFVSGILGGIFFVSSGIIFGSNVPGIGASGAVFGVLGVLAVLVPYSKIYLIIGPLILILIGAMAEFIFPANMLSFVSLVINILIIVMIFSLFSFNPSMRKFAVPVELQMWLLPIVAIVPLVIIGFFISLPIGNSAHIGGLVSGIFFGIYLRNKFPRKTRMLRRHFQ